MAKIGHSHLIFHCLYRLNLIKVYKYQLGFARTYLPLTEIVPNPDTHFFITYLEQALFLSLAWPDRSSG